MNTYLLCLVLNICANSPAEVRQHDTEWRKWRVEYESSLEYSWPEAEDQCDYAIESNNPLLKSWYNRHCL